MAHEWEIGLGATASVTDDPDLRFVVETDRPGAYRIDVEELLKREILRLAEERDRLEAYVSKCEALVVRYGDELTSLRAEREELAQRNVELEERVRELEDESEARIWGRIESLRADLEAAKGLRDVAAGERDELAVRVKYLEAENSKLRFAEARLTSLRLEVDERGKRIAHLETLIRGHETNTRLFKARIDALIAAEDENSKLRQDNLSLVNSLEKEGLKVEDYQREIANLRTDLREAIKTGEEQHCFRRDVSITLGLGKETPTIDEVRAAIQQMQDTTKKMAARLARLDALLSSDEPPEGLRDWMSRLKPGPMPMTGAERAWRWFREQLGEKHS